MARLLQVGRKLINLDNIVYIDLGPEDNPCLSVHFIDGECMDFTGDDGTLLWELLEEENYLRTSSARP